LKTKFLFLWFFLFFISNAFGQTEVRLSQKDWYIDIDNDGDFIIRKSTIFSYLPSGKMKEEMIDEYDIIGDFMGRRGIFYNYSEDESLLLSRTAKRYNSTVNLWILENWTDYTYDENGCEIKQEYFQNVGGLLTIVDFERNANCQKTKETTWLKFPMSDTLTKFEIKTFTYFPDGISYEEELFRTDFFSGEEVLHSRFVVQYNSDGLLEETQRITNLKKDLYI